MMADDWEREWDDAESADYHDGHDAGEAGEPDDGTRSPRWREGWRDWSEDEANRQADDEAWGGRGPSRSYAEWAAEG